MKKNHLAATIVVASLWLASCSAMPEVSGAGAQVATGSKMLTQAAEVGVVNNVPLWAVGLIALGFWCVRTPWGIISDFKTAQRQRRVANLKVL